MALTTVTTGMTKDAAVAAINANDAQIETTANAALPKSGGTMTGKILLDGAPTETLHPATKAYVDAVGAAKVGNTGDETVAGTKTFSTIPVLPASDPTSGNQAARKTYVDQVATSVVFCSPMKAGFSTGNEPTAYGDWAQTDSTYKVKVRFTFVKRTGHKYLHLRGYAKASAAAGWGVKLATGALSGTDSGTNTSYGGTPEVDISLDISGLADGSHNIATIELNGANGSTTGYLREDVCVTLDPG